MIEEFSIHLYKYDPDPAAPFADLQKHKMFGAIWIDGKEYKGFFPIEKEDLNNMERFFRVAELTLRSAKKSAKKHFAEISEDG